MGLPRRISLSFEGNSVSFSVPPANRCLLSVAPGTGRPAHVAGRFFGPERLHFYRRKPRERRKSPRMGCPRTEWSDNVAVSHAFAVLKRGYTQRNASASVNSCLCSVASVREIGRRDLGSAVNTAKTRNPRLTHRRKVSACAGRDGTRGSPLFSLNHRAFSAAPNYAFQPSETAFSPLFSLHDYFSPKSSCRARGDW